MPLVSLESFFSKLAIIEVSAELSSNASRDENGSGSLNRASYGTRLWYGSVNIRSLPHADADVVAAKLEYIKEADVVFRISPAWKSSLTVSTGTVDFISGDRRQMLLSETLTEGEIFGVQYGDSRSMHRVVSSDGFFHLVVPPLPFGVNVNDPITVGKPEIDAVWDGSQLPKYRANAASGSQFDWIQNV